MRMTNIQRRILAGIALLGAVGALLVAVTDLLPSMEPQWRAVVDAWRRVFPERIDVKADDTDAEPTPVEPKEEPDGE